MDRDTWVSHYQYGSVITPLKYDSFSDVNDEINKDIISFDSLLPDDLLERILAYLPVASIFRASCVCKRWHDIVTSKRFLWNFSVHFLSHKPWYFMFTGSDEPYGYSFDPAFKKWYAIDLPYFVTSNWCIASSFGLLCFMNNDSQFKLYVYNPVTKRSKKLMIPPGVKFSDYSSHAIYVDKGSHNYNVCIVKSKEVPDNFYQWVLSIHVYNSETMMWVTSLTEVLNGWRTGDESVICDGVLYILLYSVRGGMPDNHRHGLIKYDLSSHSSRGLLITQLNSTSQCNPCGLLMKSFIPAPCSLTCGRLMNLKEKLVMVGGIGKQDRSDIIKGIGIWVLKGNEWQEVARMPHKYFQGFGEFDDVFTSGGAEDLIYIQSFGSPALLLFDMNQKQWKWSQKSPIIKRFPLQTFNGFCFEPRLEVSP